MKKLFKFAFIFLVIFELLIYTDVIMIENEKVLFIHDVVKEKIITIFKKVSKEIEKLSHDDPAVLSSEGIQEFKKMYYLEG